MSDGDAFIAVVASEKNVVAYVCNGGRGIAEFFVGPRRGERVKLVSARRAKLSASIDADGTKGTIELGRRGPLEFSAKPAEGEAGLYQVPRARPVKAGWVVLSDGRQRGTLAGSTVNPRAMTASVPDLGTVSVARVSSRQVSGAESGFGGKGFGFGGGLSDP